MSAMSVDVFVPLLVGCLRKEHNADIMLLASRAMCNMMDVLPSSPAALEAARAATANPLASPTA